MLIQSRAYHCQNLVGKDISVYRNNLVSLPIEKYAELLDLQIEFFPNTSWECNFGIDPKNSRRVIGPGNIAIGVQEH